MAFIINNLEFKQSRNIQLSLTTILFIHYSV